MKKPTYYLLTIVSIFFLLLSNSFASFLDLHIVSNADWKANKLEEVGWTTLSYLDMNGDEQDFDDSDGSGWTNARSPYETAPASLLSIPPNPDLGPLPRNILPGDIISGTSADFIWYNDPDLTTYNGQNGPSRAFFRYTFNLDINREYDSFLRGRAKINADDDYKFYVNGDLVYINDSTGSLDVADDIDFTSFLKNGDNIIAIDATDTGVYERLLFDGNIIFIPAPSVPALMFLGLFSLGFLPKEKLKNRI